mmetsp:Transcript_46766/g.138160  ORF Transcript_46766/g.138160 Transcript_46766/m.138160 type:complete len:314 (-) Transcript_46766:2-943(-)
MLLFILGVEDALHVRDDLRCRELRVHVCLQRGAENLHVAELPEVVVPLALQAVERGPELLVVLLRLQHLRPELLRLPGRGAPQLRGHVHGVVAGSPWPRRGRRHRRGPPGGRPAAGRRRAQLLLRARRARPGVQRGVLLLAASDQRAHRCPGPLRHGLPLPRLRRVVVLAAGAFPLPVALHPLQELQVVLVLAADELVHVNVLVDAVLVERRLKHLVVGDVLVLRLRHPVHLLHGDGARVAGVQDLAVDGAARALLDLGQAHLEQPVHPREEVPARNEEGALHHADCGRRLAHAPAGHGARGMRPGGGRGSGV